MCIQTPDNIGEGIQRLYSAGLTHRTVHKERSSAMLVYVINRDGQPLMPTERCGKVRRLLRDGKARVVKRCPFTIQLLFETTDQTQPVTLGVDAGSKHIGLSATTEDRVLYEADVEIRNDIVDLLSTRREQRRARRNRKTRYRAPRFDNRRRPEGRHSNQQHQQNADQFLHYASLPNL